SPGGPLAPTWRSSKSRSWATPSWSESAMPADLAATINRRGLHARPHYSTVPGRFPELNGRRFRLGAGRFGTQAARTRVVREPLSEVSCHRTKWGESSPRGTAVPDYWSAVPRGIAPGGLGRGSLDRPSGHAGIRVRCAGDQRHPGISEIDPGPQSWT